MEKTELVQAIKTLREVELKRIQQRIKQLEAELDQMNIGVFKPGMIISDDDEVVNLGMLYVREEQFAPPQMYHTPEQIYTTWGWMTPGRYTLVENDKRPRLFFEAILENISGNRDLRLQVRQNVGYAYFSTFDGWKKDYVLNLKTILEKRAFRPTLTYDRSQNSWLLRTII